ncbi:MAG: DUF4846 domain-containing protein [Saprospiraceae bacterium]
MKTLPLAVLLLAALAAFTCFQEKTPNQFSPAPSVEIQPDSLLDQRFPPPPGFHRPTAKAGSFAEYLRHLPLKPPGTKVRYFDGREKENPGIYAAVVNLPIGRRDLHQCADAVIRLRAEYLWRSGQYDQIRFHLTNGFLVEYERWRQGERVKVVANQTSWQQKSAASNSYATFWSYLEFVFSYAGTLSLARELQSVPVSDMQIGDIFIQGGSPGHAILVVDMAVDAAGKKVFMLAQSYMPAQETQILMNPANRQTSPWYTADFGNVLITPQWTFDEGALGRF